MKLRAAGIAIGVLLVYTILNYYIGWHILTFFADLFGLRGAWFWPLFSLVAASFLLWGAMRKWLPKPLAKSLKVIGALWMAPFQYLLLMLPIVDAAALVLYAIGVPMDAFVPAAGWAVVLALMIVLAYGAYNAWSPVVRRYRIEVGKAAPVRRLKVAVASDLHLGVLVGRRHLQKLVDLIHAEQPDLILLAGDVIEEEAGPFRKKRLDRLMRDLHATYGVYAVLGNHEYYGGEVEDIILALKDARVHVLLDERVFVAESVWLVGRKDRTAESELFGGRLPLDELLADLPMDEPIIVIDHQPTALREAMEWGVDVLVSGHTHRGQLAPNHWITRRLFELDWGLKKDGRFHAVVSSGFGTWGPPFRTGSRSELIVLDIRFRS